MDECRAFQPDVDECALHARQHADHTAQVNIAYMAALDAALDMQFLHAPCSTSATRVSNG